MTIELYDRELKQIYPLWAQISYKYSKLPLNEKNLRELTVETQNRFAAIGFNVRLILDSESSNYTIDILGRIDKQHEFDVEEKIWEVKRAKKNDEFVKELG